MVGGGIRILSVLGQDQAIAVEKNGQLGEATGEAATGAPGRSLVAIPGANG